MASAATAHRLFATRPRSGALADAAIAVVSLAVSLALLSHHAIGSSQRGPRELDWVSGVLAACSAVPLVAWRRAPRAVFATTASAGVVLGGLGYSIWVLLGPTAALYLLAASRDEADPWTRGSTTMVVALFAASLGATGLGSGAFPWTELLLTGLAWAVAWFAGERTRLRREQVAELKERALRADREKERERRLAVAEERARIARDLHDSAGHAINVIAVRAGAARMRYDRNPQGARAALHAIEELARHTAREIDQIVGTLRDPQDEGTTAPPGLASLRTLVAHHSAGGLEVAVATAGTPRPPGPSVDLAAYRILQEGLTNAARHGTGAARLELAFGEAALLLTITNHVADHAADAGPRGRGGGHGLIGMHERATLLGGSLDVERANGTFRVRACLPYQGHVP
jgi:signal transduction histidine kinase